MKGGGCPRTQCREHYQLMMTVDLYLPNVSSSFAIGAVDAEDSENRRRRRCNCPT